jgi:hypothetical protein
VPLVTATGEVEGICGISTDITDLRRTELALQEAVEKLERQQDNKMMNIEAVTATSCLQLAAIRGREKGLIERVPVLDKEGKPTGRYEFRYGGQQPVRRPTGTRGSRP